MMVAGQALFSGQLNGMIAWIFQNERPLLGLAGQLDWETHGIFSEALRVGSLEGNLGEVTYFPHRIHGKTYHFVLVGGGFNEKPGERKVFDLAQKCLERINKSVTGLKLTQLGVSLKDFGLDSDPEKLKNLFKGLPISVVQ